MKDNCYIEILDVERLEGDQRYTNDFSINDKIVLSIAPSSFYDDYWGYFDVRYKLQKDDKFKFRENNDTSKIKYTFVCKPLDN